MSRSIERQYKKLTGDAVYPMEKHPLKATGTVSVDHHNMVILLGDANKGTDTDSKLVRIIDIGGYHIGCADKTNKANGKISSRNITSSSAIIVPSIYYIVITAN